MDHFLSDFVKSPSASIFDNAAPKFAQMYQYNQSRPCLCAFPDSAVSTLSFPPSLAAHAVSCQKSLDQ